jgi:hypothetical protein
VTKDTSEERWRKHEEVGREVEKRVPGLKFSRSGYRGACSFGSMTPWEARGSLDGHPFYARYRMDTAAMSVWAPGTELDDYELGDLMDTEYSSVIRDFYGDQYRGYIETDADEMVAYFSRLISKLQPTDPDTNPNHTQALSRYIEAYTAAYKAKTKS